MIVDINSILVIARRVNREFVQEHARWGSEREHATSL
jgi:hypothetical protein